MYQRILIPLDGSELAECALPHAKEIAKGCNIGEVVLLEVVEPPSSFTGGSIDFITFQNASHRAIVEAAEGYVAKVQSQLSSEGLNVRSEVLIGKAAETIMEFAEKNAVDIIAIATHGRSGISRWRFGSVANKLLQASHVPILIIRPAGAKSSI
jgi:nucleotide-binding universal stress UspA family protein